MIEKSSKWLRSKALRINLDCTLSQLNYPFKLNCFPQIFRQLSSAKRRHVAERLNMDETLWPSEVTVWQPRIWLDTFWQWDLCLVTKDAFLNSSVVWNRSLLPSEQCSWNSAGNFNKKPTGPSRFNRKSLIVIILINNFYIIFFGQTGIWITFVNTKTRERLRNLWLPGFMEGTSQENKSDLWNHIEWKSPAWSVCKKCERLFCV